MVSPSGVSGVRQSTATPTSNEETRQLARELVAHGFAPKIQARHISNHNMAERLFLGRMSLANNLGLDNEVLQRITPYPTQPGNNTMIYNDTQPLLALLCELVKQKPAEVKPVPTAPAPTSPTPSPVTPIAAAAVKRWLWPLIAALGVSAVGGTAWSLWPQPATPKPSTVNADFEVRIR